MSARSIDHAADRRRRQLAAIHVAKKALGLDRETYVALLERVAGVQSSADLDGAGRDRVLDELRRQGAPEAKGRGAHQQQARATFPNAPRAVNTDLVPLMDKVEALLADAKRPWNYAHSMARRMFHVTRVEWLRPDQLHRLVAALEYDRRRRGRADLSASLQEIEE